MIVLLGLLVASVVTGRAARSFRTPSGLTVDVIGHQWRWEIAYEGALPSDRVVTANELHIPVGRPVIVKVGSRDVIHSFWVPNLIGKRDLIPGYTTAIWLDAARPGIFRGQCAEFCGLQHAHMAITVVAEPDSAFRAWLARMRQPASGPETLLAQQGRDGFMGARCPACHTIRGTDAAGQTAPDLTHLAARRSLGAGTMRSCNEPARRFGGGRRQSGRDVGRSRRSSRVVPTTCSPRACRSSARASSPRRAS